MNQFSTDSDRLDHTVIVLSAPFKARRCAAEAAWNAALAAKAPQGVPANDMTYTETLARELALRVLGRSAVPISSYDSEQKAKEIVELLTYEAAAPVPSKLPVPGPVSDTTIHHWMFPPAASVVAAKCVNCGQPIYDNGTVYVHRKVLNASTVLETQWCHGVDKGFIAETELSREAAAPKPAPDATEERALATARGDFSTFPLCVPSAEKLMELREKFNAKFETKGPARPDRTVGGTPAPGAERPAEQTITQKLRGRPVTHAEAKASAQRLINSHFHNPDQARASIPVCVKDDDVVVFDYILECEALAAAPPAPAELTHAELCPIFKDAGLSHSHVDYVLKRINELGNRHASAERPCNASPVETEEGMGSATQASIRPSSAQDTEIILALRDGQLHLQERLHASAERVRELERAIQKIKEEYEAYLDAPQTAPTDALIVAIGRAYQLLPPSTGEKS